MAAPAPSLLRKAYLKYLTLRLPWRRRILIGHDLNSNLYFELLPTSSSTSSRNRRIMSPSPALLNATTGSSKNYSEVSANISPAWHQWLRHTRKEAPSWVEQIGEVRRQDQLRTRVQEADRRWREGEMLESAGQVGRLEGKSKSIEDGKGQLPRGNVKQEVEGEQNPWKRAREGPSESWQPAAWSGMAGKRGG